MLAPDYEDGKPKLVRSRPGSTNHNVSRDMLGVTHPSHETEVLWAEATGAPGPRLTTATGSFEVEYFESGDDRVFGAYHTPPGTPLGRALICSPISKEWATNHRREVVLSWELAARGFAVQRFCYRGCGESGGDTLDITFERMVADAEVALAKLTERSGDVPLIVHGTRFGAFVAAAVARQSPGAALVFWQPFIQGSSFFREVFRAQLIGELKQGRRSGSSKETLTALEEDKSVDVLGDPIGWDLYQSASELSLVDLVDDKRHGLLVQMSARNQVKSEYSKLADHFDRLGGSLDIQVVEDEEAWWFGARSGPRKLEIRAAALEAIPMTVRFASAAVKAR